MFGHLLGGPKSPQTVWTSLFYNDLSMWLWHAMTTFSHTGQWTSRAGTNFPSQPHESVARCQERCPSAARIAASTDQQRPWKKTARHLSLSHHLLIITLEHTNVNVWLCHVAIKWLYADRPKLLWRMPCAKMNLRIAEDEWYVLPTRVSLQYTCLTGLKYQMLGSSVASAWNTMVGKN